VPPTTGAKSHETVPPLLIVPLGGVAARLRIAGLKTQSEIRTTAATNFEIGKPLRQILEAMGPPLPDRLYLKDWQLR